MPDIYQSIMPGMAASGNRQPFEMVLSGEELFAVDFTQGLIPLVDQGNGYIFTGENGDHMHTDHEGRVRDCRPDEARMQGSRRVENILPSSDLRTWGTISSNFSAEDLGNGRTRITCINAAAFQHVLIGLIPVGRFISVRYGLKWVTGIPKTLRLLKGTFAGVSVEDITPTFEDVVYCVTNGEEVVSFAGNIGFGSTAAQLQPGDQFEVFGMQVEYVEGQSNTLSASYVSAGVGNSEELNSDFYLQNPFYWDDSAVGWTWTAGKLTGVRQGATMAWASLERSALPLDRTKLYVMIVKVENFTVNGGTGFGQLSNFSGSNVFNITRNGWIYLVLRLDGTADQDDFWFGVQGDGINECSFDITEVSIKTIDHGSNVDNVKYFNRANENTRSGLILTEVPGRFIHPSVTKGCLVEMTRINRAFHYQPQAASWTNFQSTFTVNNAIAPNGLLEATLVQEAATANTHGFYATAQEAPGSPYTFSIYVKQRDAARPRVIIDIWGTGTGAFVCFDLSTGTIVDTTGTFITHSSIKYIRDGWFRVSVTSSDQGFNHYIEAYMGTATSTSSSLSYTGDGSSGMWFWGAQIEAAEFRTSLIPSNGSLLTRTQEVLKYAAENWRQGAVGIFEFYWPGFKLPDGTAGANIFSMYSAPSSFLIGVDSSTEELYVVASSGGGSLRWLKKIGTLKKGSYRMIVRLSTNSFTDAIGTMAYLNGQQLVVNLVLGSPFVLNPEEIYFGLSEGGIGLNGWANYPLKSARILTGPLTNAELQELSK